MIGTMPIVDRNGSIVATLTWKGTMWRGKGKWNYASDEIKKRIGAAISENADLGTSKFSDMVGDASWVRGWQGFAGWFQALSIALSAYGLKIDNDHVEWPFDHAGEQQKERAS